MPLRVTISPSSITSPSCKLKKVNWRIDTPVTAPSSTRSLLGTRSSLSQEPHTEEGHHLCLKDHHVGRKILLCTTISFCVNNTVSHHMASKQYNWQLFHLGGIVIVCVQLLALVLGIDYSGVAWASLCAVWVPACIGCTSLVALLCDVWLVFLPCLSGEYLCTTNCFCCLTVISVTWCTNLPVALLAFLDWKIPRGCFEKDTLVNWLIDWLYQSYSIHDMNFIWQYYISHISFIYQSSIFFQSVFLQSVPGLRIFWALQVYVQRRQASQWVDIIDHWSIIDHFA